MSGMGEESTVDWRGRPSIHNKHGGMRAAAFVLGKFVSLYLFECVCIS
jgi:hypothetical protein